jgi:hypothetical protein
VGGKNNSTAFYFDFTLAGLLDQPGRIGLSPETPSPYLPGPDQRIWFRSCSAFLKKM